METEDIYTCFLSYFQVLVTTKNLAWTTDFRARLVVVKGTEQYDVKAQTYADMPLSGLFKLSASVRCSNF